MAKAIAVRRRRAPNPARVRRSRRAKFTLPLAIVAGFAPLVVGGITEVQRGGLPSLAQWLAGNLAGYSIESKKFYPDAMIKGWTPILMGVLAHKLASALGVNRALAQARIPILRF